MNFQNTRPISLGMPQVNCINPVRDITKCPLPPLEEIARVASIQLRDVVVKGIQSRKDLDLALKVARIDNDWFPDNSSDCEQSLELNNHLGAEEVMSLGRVQDPKGAKTIVLNYKTVAGAMSAVIKHMLISARFTKEDTKRMRQDPTLTSGRTVGAHP